MSFVFPKKKQGRKTKLTDDAIKKIPDMVRLEMTQTEIAELLGVHQTTVGGWLRNNKAFSLNYALEQAKIDYEVKEGLLKRAQGMTVKETREVDSDKNGYSKTVVEREIPPDTEAAKYWLENRRPSKWKRSPDTVIANMTSFSIEMSDGTVETIQVAHGESEATSPSNDSMAE